MMNREREREIGNVHSYRRIGSTCVVKSLCFYVLKANCVFHSYCVI